MTRYRDHLFSDMGNYWSRALSRLGGDETSFGQWGSPWPPMPHILLAQLFRLIHWLGLDDLRLEMVLSTQILLSAASVLLLHQVAVRTFRDLRAANVATILYAFSYPMVYLCGAVLSEGPAIPLLILAVWLTIGRERLWCPALAGATLALAVALRPAYTPLVAVFGIYWLCRPRSRRASLLRSTVFAVTFVLALAPVSAENARISGGRLTSLSANGGLNFFLNASKVHQVRSHVDGYSYFIIPPATVNHPENGLLETDVPFLQQDWYYQQGWEHLCRRPTVLLDNLRGMETVFFGPLMPHFEDAAGIGWLLPLSNVLNCGLFLTIPFLLWAVLFRRSAVSEMRADVLFLIGLVAMSFATMYVFGAEQRYLYSFLFAVILLAVCAARIVMVEWQALRRPMAIYVASLAGLWATGQVIEKMPSTFHERTVTVTVMQNRTHVASLLDKRDVVSGRTVQVDQLRFPFGRTLRHSQLGELGFSRNYFIEAETSFRFLTTGDRITFEVYSDDGFSLQMDAKPLNRFVRDRMFPEVPNRAAVTSDGRQHTLRITHFQGEGPQGLFVFYTIRDEAGREHRYAVGESSGAVQFLPVEEREGRAVISQAGEAPKERAP